MRGLPAVPLLLAALLALTACGGRFGIGKKTEQAAAPEAVDLTRPNTPENRAVQVGWTVAGAYYCGFNVPREQMRAAYLAYERKQGAAPDQLAALERSYDVTYATGLETMRKQPNFCNAKRVEAIRADLQRHLKGDYAPSERSPPRPAT